jgi:hypothetical protein
MAAELGRAASRLVTGVGQVTADQQKPSTRHYAYNDAAAGQLLVLEHLSDLFLQLYNHQLAWLHPVVLADWASHKFYCKRWTYVRQNDLRAAGQSDMHADPGNSEVFRNALAAAKEKVRCRG